MRKAELKKPLLICLYGLPGSGKSFVGRNLTRLLPIAHLNTDRICSELLSRSMDRDQQEAMAFKLAAYIADEFLRTGVSVAFDANALNVAQRQKLRDIAIRNRAGYLLIWLQIDQESAFARAASRDKRTLEGKYSSSSTRAEFNQHLSEMENPDHEDFLVVSGKHTFASQKSAIINRLYQMNLVDSSALTENVIKPELVNLIPNFNSGAGGFNRRDLSI